MHPPVKARPEDAGRHPPVAARRPFYWETGRVLVSAELVCSARGCREPADWALRWNNPRLHSPERRKTWLACDSHREYLESFLSIRGFLRETVPGADLTADDQPGASPGAGS